MVVTSLNLNPLTLIVVSMCIVILSSKSIPTTKATTDANGVQSPILLCAEANEDDETDLQSPTNVLARLPTFCSICLGMYQFIPHPPPPFNVVYCDEFVIARFQHCLGGRNEKCNDQNMIYLAEVTTST